jgi:hypothetical protein
MSAIPCRNPLNPPPRYDEAEPFQQEDYCVGCHRTGQTFVAVAGRDTETGKFEECTGCGEERIAPFTRGNSEAA